MKNLLDRMNLRPAERRLVVAVSLMVFFMLNVWLVFPHFSDLKKVQNRIAKARRTKAEFQKEINQVAFYRARLKDFESENLNVPIEDQSSHFSNTREAAATESDVRLNVSRIMTSTNQFFIELTQTISLQAKEQNLVNFIYNLGAGNSLIRVRDLSLRPSPSQQELSAQAKLATSYQKTPLPRAAAPVQVAASAPLGATTASSPPKITNDVTNTATAAPPRNATPRTLPPPGKAPTTQPGPKLTPKKS